ncbi:hypothetical protein ACYOEI_20585 [Singulisphaera rosea]
MADQVLGKGTHRISGDSPEVLTAEEQFLKSARAIGDTFTSIQAKIEASRKTFKAGFGVDGLKGAGKLEEGFDRLTSKLDATRQRTAEPIRRELGQSLPNTSGPNAWSLARQKQRAREGRQHSNEHSPENQLAPLATGLEVKVLQDQVARAVGNGEPNQATKLNAQLPEAEARRDAGNAVGMGRRPRREFNGERYAPAFHGLTEFSRTLQTNALKQDDAKRTAVATEKSASILRSIEAQMRAQRPSSNSDIDISE